MVEPLRIEVILDDFGSKIGILVKFRDFGILDNFGGSKIEILRCKNREFCPKKGSKNANFQVGIWGHDKKGCSPI